MIESPTLGAATKARPRSEQLIAIMDIGSNSVRLVVYKGLRRNPLVFFNERVLCGLGAGVSESGRLADAPMALALDTLQRFAHLSDDMAVDQVVAVATAAVRNAANGEDFVAQVLAASGISVEIITGEDEARYSALGVLNSIPGADGIVGDLGGGSLELVNLIGAEPRERVTLPIGPLSLAEEPGEVTDQHRRQVEASLAGVSWLRQGKGRPFYLVGGSWRALARLYMHQIDYPLTVLHAYELGRQEMAAFARQIASRHPEDLLSVKAVTNRRVDVLPLAAMTLVACLNVIRPTGTHVSGAGIREGILLELLPAEIRTRHPLITACRDFAEETGRFPDQADRLMEWLDPVFEGENADQRRLRLACCLLSDISWRGHPDFRAEHAFHLAFEGHFVGVTHPERAQMALALYLCYGGLLGGPTAAAALQLLDDAEMEFARLIGLGLRLGQRLAGGTSQPLKITWLTRGRKKLKLHLPAGSEALAGEGVKKRLNELAEALELEAKLKMPA